MAKFLANDVLIVVDVQNDFLPGGSLAVPAGDEIIAVINQIAPLFANVVVTQDWHPDSHISFASSHPQHSAGQMMQLPYGSQILWPDHCVQGSFGAQIADELQVKHAQLVLRKGVHSDIDSYSAFIEADRRTSTGLAGYLKERNIKRCYICGLATDFCVAWTAQDARSLGFDAIVIEDACRAIDIHDSLNKAWQSMLALGVERINCEDIVGESHFANSVLYNN